MAAPGGVRVVRLLPPDEWRSRQLGVLKDVGEKNYRQGTSMPKKDPIAAGIAAEGKWREELKKAMDLNMRVIGLQATNMTEWYQYTQNIGAPKLVDGVLKREAKVDKFVKAWHPLLTDHVAKMDAIEVVTDKDAEDKMIANLRGLKALHGAWKGVRRPA